MPVTSKGVAYLIISWGETYYNVLLLGILLGVSKDKPLAHVAIYHNILNMQIIILYYIKCIYKTSYSIGAENIWMLD